MHACTHAISKKSSPISHVLCVCGQHEGGLRKRVSQSATRTKRPSIEAGEKPLVHNEMMARGCKSLSELSSPGTDKVTSAVSQDINSYQAFGAHVCICACICMYACMYMYVFMYACADGWIDGWMDGWMDRWMNSCVHSCCVCVCVCVCVLTCPQRVRE